MYIAIKSFVSVQFRALGTTPDLKLVNEPMDIVIYVSLHHLTLKDWILVGGVLKCLFLVGGRFLESVLLSVCELCTFSSLISWIKEFIRFFLPEYVNPKKSSTSTK